MATKKATAPAKRAAKDKTPSTATKPKPVAAQSAFGPAVRVRMYRQGLGDCFLITFDLGGNEKHMLIDCGTLGTKATPGVKLSDVVDDIATTTQNHLHLLIATHEHQDHISGFGSQKNKFAQIKIDNIWMAWTEDPDDELAQQLAKDRRDLGAALKAVAASPAAAGSSAREAIAGMLGFFGESENDSPVGFAEGLNETMSHVRNGLGPQATFHKPGEGPITPSWLDGFRIYVLGPPRSESALKDMGTDTSSELYHLGIGASVKGLAAAISGATRAEKIQCEEQMPFDTRYRRDTAEASRWFEEYGADASKWRRIDSDWLTAASDLALQLDSITNNTSLAIAIERIADGRVLLFPADAQEGNWLSWHDAKLMWRVADAGGVQREVTAADLLNRTVFYKVGHHSSHNATARTKGLELMKRESELVAFIPVDRQVALGRSPKGSWKMPARALYRRLLEKCQGRVVRADLGWAAHWEAAGDRETEQEFDGLATADEWERWEKNQNAASVVVNGLSIDFILK